MAHMGFHLLLCVSFENEIDDCAVLILDQMHDYLLLSKQLYELVAKSGRVLCDSN